jgi:type IV pilus assembly protein PilZ
MADADENTGESGAERRIARRLPVRVMVEYECLEDFLVDYTANVSVGGMFIKTNSPLEVGTRFRLRFRLPGMDRPIDTYAVVRWALRPDEAGPMIPGMGVAFEELSEQDAREVEKMLAEWE